MDELKPCPFCGGKATISKTIDGMNWQIVCRGECRCMSAYFAQKEKAIATWNRRPAPENKPLTLEQLRQMDGEPVWVVFAGNVDWPPKAHWCFVRATKCILQVYPCAVHQAKNWLYTEQDFNRGVANAYARKPEGSA